MPELLAELDQLGDPPGGSAEWPFLLLAAGERRSFTANTIFRDPHGADSPGTTVPRA